LKPRTTTAPRRALALLAYSGSVIACAFGMNADANTRDSVSRPFVAAANATAATIGLDVLHAGGTAMDAAVAVQAALTLLEPPESGIGGGAFLTYLDAATGTMTVYDGRERAPAAATAQRFQLFGWPVPRWVAIPSGRAVGVPGVVALLDHAHRAHGVLPWADLWEPTITMAEHGVSMPARLEQQIANDWSLRLFRDTRRYFVHASRADPPRLVNRALAETLRVIAAHGADGFHAGEMADDIVAAARGRWPWRSDLTRADLAAYTVIERAPLCGRYRAWTICGPPPPSSGTLAVLQVLGMLEEVGFEHTSPHSVDAIHLIAEASRLAFADRLFHLGDPDYVDVPTDALLAPDYIAGRARLIQRARALHDVYPGDPRGPIELPDAPELDDYEGFGTTHFSIVDGAGNVVSMTSSIEAPFGSRIMVRGFLLNNQLTDFSFRHTVDGMQVPNAVAPGKRPLSSMSPLIVLDDDGTVRLVIGSRGGSRIIGYVIKVLIGVLDWELSIADAIAAPNFLHRGEVLELERGTAIVDEADPLRALGHRVRVVRLESGSQGIERAATGWRAAGDPRIAGATAGQ
jgi:gamma-glutamyltranspeptidase / glutathione hydrolase